MNSCTTVCKLAKSVKSVLKGSIGLVCNLIYFILQINYYVILQPLPHSNMYILLLLSQKIYKNRRPNGFLNLFGAYNKRNKNRLRNFKTIKRLLIKKTQKQKSRHSHYLYVFHIESFSRCCGSIDPDSRISRHLPIQGKISKGKRQKMLKMNFTFLTVNLRPLHG